MNFLIKQFFLLNTEKIKKIKITIEPKKELLQIKPSQLSLWLSIFCPIKAYATMPLTRI